MYTQCPQCQTLFRITHEQLHAAHGKVRCGQCHSVFNATAQLVAHLPQQDPATPPVEGFPDDNIPDSASVLAVGAETPPASAEHTDQKPDATNEQSELFSAPHPEVTVEEAMAAAGDSPAFPAVEDTGPEEQSEIKADSELPDIETGDLAVPEVDFTTIDFEGHSLVEEHETEAQEESPVETVTAETTSGTLEPETSDETFGAAAEIDVLASDELNELLTGDATHVEPSFPDTAEAMLAATLEEADEPAEIDIRDEVPESDTDGVETPVTIPEADDMPDATSADEAPQEEAARDENPVIEDEAQPVSRPVPTTPRIDPSEVHEVLLEGNNQGHKGSLLATLGWSVLVLALCATLALQYVYQKRDTFARLPELRPHLETLCELTGCKLPLRIQLRAIELSERDIHSHERYDGALVITGTLVNQADFPQPYPLVEVIMRDLSGARVASRQFLPEEYLPARPEPAFAPRAVARLELEVLDPGSEAVSFEFAFH